MDLSQAVQVGVGSGEIVNTPTTSLNRTAGLQEFGESRPGVLCKRDIDPTRSANQIFNGLIGRQTRFLALDPSFGRFSEDV